MPTNPVATTPIVAQNVVQSVTAVPGGIPTPIYYNMQQIQQQQTVVPPSVTPTAAAPLPQRQPQQQPINVTPTGAPIGQFNAKVSDFISLLYQHLVPDIHTFTRVFKVYLHPASP